MIQAGSRPVNFRISGYSLMAEIAEQQGVRQEPKRKVRKMREGVVTSAHKTPKTIRVSVDTHVSHPKYGKYVRHTSRLLAHDEKEAANIGDRVRVMECRPLSKTKTWRLVEVLERAPE